MKEVSWTEFRIASVAKIAQRKSVIVTSDGDFAFLAIVRPLAEMRSKLIALASQLEGGRDFEEWPD